MGRRCPLPDHAAQVQIIPLELLAPARNTDIGIAAIDCGADAVYIAGPAFGARAAAGNAVEDIDRLCRYAHRYGAKVHATVNTLLTDEERPQALALMQQLYEAGVVGEEQGTKPREIIMTAEQFEELLRNEE